MQRVTRASAYAAPPAPPAPAAAPGYFGPGNPATALAATTPGYEWFNAVQEELIGVIAAAGIAPSAADLTQLQQAIRILGSSLSVAEGRLTLTSGDPVSPDDVTGAVQVHYAPYVGERLALPTAAAWETVTFPQLTNVLSDTTKNPAAAVANAIYDLFVWNDAGTVRLSRGPAWSSDTARAAGGALVRRNGVWVNGVAIANGPAVQRGRYVGTIRTTAAGALDDTVLRRFVWNADNRLVRALAVSDSALSWTYATVAWRQANANAANQVQLVTGLRTDAVEASVLSVQSNGSGQTPSVGIGLNSTTVNSASARGAGGAVSANLASAAWRGVPAIGLTTLAWLEIGATSGAQSWFGSAGSNGYQSGMTASTRA